MKKLLIAAALTAAAASPTFAATVHHHRAVNTAPVATESYAMLMTSNAVVQDGQLLGVDPDPFIRGQLAREGSPADYSN